MLTQAGAAVAGAREGAMKNQPAWGVALLLALLLLGGGWIYFRRTYGFAVLDHYGHTLLGALPYDQDRGLNFEDMRTRDIGPLELTWWPHTRWWHQHH